MQALVDPKEQIKQYVTAICCFEHSYEVINPYVYIILLATCS